MRIRALLTILILLAANALAAPVWQGHEEIQNGVLTVFNPAKPINPPAVLKPVPEWRLGGDDDPNETLFGLVTDAQRNADGTSYLLDAVLSTIHEVGPDGEIRRTLGREGDGPGEFRNAVSLALLPDNKVGIVEMMPSHMVVLGPDGLDRPGIDFGEGGSQNNVQRITVLGDMMIMGMFGMKFEAGTAEISQTLGCFNLDGSLRHRILHTSETQSGGSVSISTGDDNDFINNWAVAPDGQVVVYRHIAEYLLEVFGPDGKPVRNIRRQYKSVRRPADEIAAQRRQQEKMRQRFGGNMQLEIDEMARDIENVIARPDGELWVLSSEGSRNCPDGSIGIFDVFDAKGRFDHQLRLEADYSADDDKYLVRGDHLYILKEAQNAPDRTFSGGGGSMMMIMSSGGGGDDEDDDEEPKPYEVICYRLPDGR